MALQFSQKAITDLDDIRDYTVNRWGREQWLSYYRGLADAFDLIQKHPDRGRSRELFAPRLQISFI